MNDHENVGEMRRRFVQGILLGLKPRDLHEYVTDRDCDEN